MASKKKFKRDYIILEAKDTNFRYKERVLPKAFAKVEVSEEKSVVALYLENIKYMREGYKVVAIQSDYETIDLGKVVVSEQGKGDFVLDLVNDEAEIKGIAILYERSVPLIGFKGAKIDNYEEILFMAEDEDEYEYVEVDEDSEYEYVEVDDDSEYEYIEVDDEYEEVEYIDVDDEDNSQDDDEYEYEEIEYIEIDEDEDEDSDNEYEYEEIEYIEIDDKYDYDYGKRSPYAEINNYQEIHKQTPKRPQPQQQRPQPQKQAPKQPKQSYTQPYADLNNKSASTFLMPRQIKKGLKYFKEVKPFVCDYVEDTRWWKIEISPTTLCGYTMPYLGYVNTLNFTMYSDAIMNSYKYRHYLFGVQYDEYNKRKNYIYAVPGSRSEQPDMGHTGFAVYQACDNRNDSLGYWFCFIDPKSRRIIK